MISLPISPPAPFVPPYAAAYADANANAIVVSATAPLPVTVMPAAVTALSGTTPASLRAGPYSPISGRSAILALSGTWSGSVQVTRSTDGGATRLPLTIGGAIWALFTSNCCEAVWDESDASAQLFLDITLISGTLTYRLSQ